MTSYEPFLSLGVSLGSGLLIGLQREQAAFAEGVRENHSFPGGIRTYPLFALAGSMAALLSRQTGHWMIGVTLAVLMAPLLLAYAADVRSERDRGLTSEIAFLITYLIGVLCAIDGVIDPPGTRYLVAASLAVALTALLSLKQPLHSFASKISLDDIYATIKFLILAVIVLPLLPDESFGPFNALNPFHIGLMIALMAGIGFVGYIAIRMLGAGRGLALTGLIGGLVSSTAVTLSCSAHAKKDPKIADACALAVVLASSIMLIRVVIEVSVVYRPLLTELTIPLAAMMGVGLLSAAWLYHWGRSSKEASDIQFKNPFELGLALKFGFLFALVLLASRAAQAWFGQSGIFAAAVLAGLTDMDAITLSMAGMAKGGLDHRTAATAVLLGAASNTAVKAALACSLGGWYFGKRVVITFVLMIAAGAVAASVTLWS